MLEVGGYMILTKNALRVMETTQGPMRFCSFKEIAKWMEDHSDPGDTFTIDIIATAIDTEGDAVEEIIVEDWPIAAAYIDDEEDLKLIML